MVAYSFKPQFVRPILDGTKRQTIRGPRKRHARPGERLQLYTGMRTRHCKLIAQATCVTFAPIVLDFGCAAVLMGDPQDPVRPRDLDVFARCDGFPDFDAMARFWRDTHGVELFGGWIIMWRLILGTPAAEMIGA